LVPLCNGRQVGAKRVLNFGEDYLSGTELVQLPIELSESAWEFRRLSFLEERMYSWTNGRTARGIRLS